MEWGLAALRQGSAPSGYVRICRDPRAVFEERSSGKRTFILAAMAKKGRARDVALGRGTPEVRIDHAVIEPDDLAWLAPVRRLTLWAVDVPEGFLGTLPNLDWLDVRGGSGASADFVIGCERLRYLAINQVRGLSDVSAVGELVTLELLDLYGLPKVTALPSLARLRSLARLELGSLKGLRSIVPALDAPALEELCLSRAVSMEATIRSGSAMRPRSRRSRGSQRTYRTGSGCRWCR